MNEFSVFLDERLVAQITAASDHQGLVRRANREQTILCNSPCADVLCFDAKSLVKIAELAQKAQTVDRLIFLLGVEGFHVKAGKVQPQAYHRRF